MSGKNISTSAMPTGKPLSLLKPSIMAARTDKSRWLRFSAFSISWYTVSGLSVSPTASTKFSGVKPRHFKYSASCKRIVLMGLVEKDFRVKCDRPLPLSYFLDGKGDRTFYQLPSLWADSRSDKFLSER